MKTWLPLLLALAGTTQAFEFAPTEKKERGEGSEYLYLQFRNGIGKTTYVPPRNWEYKGDGIRLSLFPKGILGSDIDMTTLTLKEPVPCVEANLKVFEGFAVQAVPKGASGVEVISAVYNPFEIDGKQTIEVVLAYSFYGQKLKASFVYADTGKKLLQFRVAAKLADFDSLRKEFQGSLHSLAGIVEPQSTRVEAARPPVQISFR